MGLSESIDKMVDEKVRGFLSTYIKMDDFASGKADFSYDTSGFFARYQNVSLRDQTFNSLPLPIELLYGQVGELKITIPSMFLFNPKNVIVSIKKLFMCVKLVDTKHWSEQSVKENYENNKQRRLQRQEELLKLLFPHSELEKLLQQENEEVFGQEDWKSKMQKKILANMTVEIEDVYIRVEAEEQRYSFGVEIKQIRLDPCRIIDDGWFKIFDQNGVRKVPDIGLQNQQQKSLSINGINLFLNCPKADKPYESIWDLLKIRKNMEIASDDESMEFEKEEDLPLKSQRSRSNSQVVKEGFQSVKQKIQHFMDNKFTSQESTEQYIIKDFCVGVRFQFCFEDLLKSEKEKIDPDVEVEIRLGQEFDYGDGKQRESDFAIKIQKEQLKAFLGFTNFINSYQVYQWGIICEAYYNSKMAQQLTFIELDKYVQHYEDSINGVYDKDQLRTFEQHYPDEFLLSVRYVSYEAIVDRQKYQRKRVPRPEQQGTGYITYMSSFFVKKQGEVQEEILTRSEKNENAHLYAERDKHLKNLQQNLNKEAVKGSGNISEISEEELLVREEVYKEDEISRQQMNGQYVKTEIHMPKLTFELLREEEGTGIVEGTVRGLQLKFSDDSRKPKKAITKIQLVLAELQINDPEAEKSITELHKDNIEFQRLGRKPVITQKIFETEKKQKQESDEYEPLVEFEMEKKLGQYDQDKETQDVEESGSALSVKLKVLSCLNFYINFDFMKKIFDVHMEILLHLTNQKIELLDNFQGDKGAESICHYLSSGFQFTELLHKQAYRRLQLASDRLKQQTEIIVDIKSPKLIIDEYLLGEGVVDLVNPVYLLVDLGEFQFKMADMQTVQSVEYSYSSVDISFSGLQLFYSDKSVAELMQPMQCHRVVDKFNFGVQLKRLDESEIEGTKPPTMVMNLLFNGLTFNYTREVFMQMWKILQLYLNGTFATKMNEFLVYGAKINKMLADKIHLAGKKDEIDESFLSCDNSGAVYDKQCPQCLQKLTNSVSRDTFKCDQCKGKAGKKIFSCGDCDYYRCEECLDNIESLGEKLQVNLIYDNIKVQFINEARFSRIPYLTMAADQLKLGVTMDQRIMDVFVLIKAISITNEKGDQLFLRQEKQPQPVQKRLTFKMSPTQKNVVRNQLLNSQLGLKRASRWPTSNLIKKVQRIEEVDEELPLEEKKPMLVFTEFKDFCAQHEFEEKDEYQVSFHMRSAARLSDDLSYYTSDKTVKLRDLCVQFDNELLKSCLQVTYNLTDDMQSVSTTVLDHLGNPLEEVTPPPAKDEKHRSRTTVLMLSKKDMRVKAKVPVASDSLPHERQDFYFEAEYLKYHADSTWKKFSGGKEETIGRMDIEVQDMRAYLRQSDVKFTNIINPFSMNISQTYASKPANLARKQGLHKPGEIETVSYSDMRVATPTDNPTIHLLIRISDIVPFLSVINQTIETLKVVQMTEVVPYEKVGADQNIEIYPRQAIVPEEEEQPLLTQRSTESHNNTEYETCDDLNVGQWASCVKLEEPEAMLLPEISDSALNMKKAITANFLKRKTIFDIAKDNCNHLLESSTSLIAKISRTQSVKEIREKKQRREMEENDTQCYNLQQIMEEHQNQEDEEEAQYGSILSFSSQKQAIQSLKDEELDLKRNVFHSKTTLNMDLKLVLLDTMAHFNEQALLEINLKRLSMEMNSLSSVLWTKRDEVGHLVSSDAQVDSVGDQSQHKFFEMLRRQEDIAAVRKFVHLTAAHDSHYYYMNVDSNFDARYYNPKANGQEFLIEPYHMSYEQEQADPMSEVKTKIKAKEFLNVNLTYGCLFSLSCTVRRLKQEESTYKTKKAVFSACSTHENCSVSNSHQQIEFNNCTGQDISIWLSTSKIDEEKELTDEIKIFDGESEKKTVETLFRNYDAEDLKHPSLFIHFRLDDQYKVNRNVLLQQSGVFCYQLTHKRKPVGLFSCQPRTHQCYVVMRVVHHAHLLSVYFESSTVVYNNSELDLTLIAFRPDTGPNPEVLHTLILNAKDQEQKKYSLPLQWFEDGLQVQVSHMTGVREGTRFELKEEHLMLQTETVDQSLDPLKVKPMHKHNKCLKYYIDKKGLQWLGLNCYLLKTRTKIGQFLITFDPLTNIKNYTGHPISIMPFDDKTEVDIPKDQKEWIQLPNLNLDGKQFPDPTYKFFEVRMKKKFNSLSIADEVEQNDLTGTITQIKLKAMRKALVVNRAVQQGTLVNLKERGKKGGAVKSVVLQKEFDVSLPDMPMYGNLTTRTAIYAHIQKSFYIMYIPLMAINETDHDLVIQDSTKSTSQVLVPGGTLYVHLTMDSQQYLNVSIREQGEGNKDVYKTEMVYFSTLGLSDVVNFSKVYAKENPRLPPMREIGTFVTLCSKPMTKTKLIKFVPCIRVINKLSQPIMLCEILPDSHSFTTALSRKFVKHNQKYHYLDKAPLNLELFTREFLLKARLVPANEQEIDPQNMVDDQKQWSDWSLSFRCDKANDFQIMMLHQQQDQTLLKEQKPGPWYRDDVGGKMFVRVTIQYHNDHQGTKYIIFSPPRQPEYILYNFTSYRGVLEQVPDQHSSTGTGKCYLFQSGSEKEPAGSIFVTDQNMPKMLQISVEDKQERNNFSMLFDLKEEKQKNKKGEEKELEIEVALRRSGSCKVVEIRKKQHEKKIGDTRRMTRQGSFPAQMDGTARVLERKHFLQKTISQGFKHACEHRLLNKESSQVVKYEVRKSTMFFNLRGVGISLVDFQPLELCYISIDQIKGYVLEDFSRKRSTTVTHTDYSLKIRNFQVDDMSATKSIQVLFGPRCQFNNVKRELHDKQQRQGTTPPKPRYPSLTVQGLNTKVQKENFFVLRHASTHENDGVKPTHTIELATLRMVPMELQVSLGFLMKIEAFFLAVGVFSKEFDFVPRSRVVHEFKRTGKIWSGRHDADEEDSGSGVDAQAEQRVSKTVAVYDDAEECPELQIKQLDETDLNNFLQQNQIVHIMEGSISELKCYMTLRVSGIQQKLQADGLFGYLIDLFGNFSRISGAEFKFQQIKIKNKPLDMSQVTTNLMTYYRSSLLHQFYQLVGSMDILGNPTMVARKLGMNTTDKIGVSAISEVSKMGLNSVNALSSATSSMSAALYQFTHFITMNKILDEDMTNPHNVKEGLTEGISGAKDEFFDGVLGLYFKPQQVLTQQGQSKAATAKGITKGVIGALAFPINCALSLTYNCATGMKNATSESRAQCQRYRYPRAFNKDKLMEKYDGNFAHAQTALRAIQNGMHSEEPILFTRDLSQLDTASGYIKERVLFVTKDDLFYVKGVVHLVHQIPISKMLGLMLYFNEETNAGNLVLELEHGRVINIQTRDPAGNAFILHELRDQLKLQERHRKPVGRGMLLIDLDDEGGDLDQDEQQKKKDEQQKKKDEEHEEKWELTESVHDPDANDDVD